MLFLLMPCACSAFLKYAVRDILHKYKYMFIVIPFLRENISSSRIVIDFLNCLIFRCFSLKALVLDEYPSNKEMRKNFPDVKKIMNRVRLNTLLYMWCVARFETICKFAKACNFTKGNTP